MFADPQKLPFSHVAFKMFDKISCIPSKGKLPNRTIQNSQHKQLIVLMLFSMPDLSDDSDSDEDDDMTELLMSKSGNLVRMAQQFAKRLAKRKRSRKLKRKKPRKKRIVEVATDWCASPWGKMLENFRIHGISNREGHLFRRRFRVPFDLFRRLVTLCHEKNLFPPAKLHPTSGTPIDAAHRALIPLELKLLGVLRILGRGWCLDDVKESSELRKARCQYFSTSFVQDL